MVVLTTIAVINVVTHVTIYGIILGKKKMYFERFSKSCFLLFPDFTMIIT